MILILQCIGLFFTLISSFIGMLYISKGNLILSLFVSIVLLVLVYFLIDQLIKKKSEIRKNRVSPLSIVLWTLYALLSLPLTILLLHSFNVEINAKEEVQALGKQKADALNGMILHYNNEVDQYINDVSSDFELNARLCVASSSSCKTLQSPPFDLDQEMIGSLNKSNITSKKNDFVEALQYKFHPARDSADFSYKHYLHNYDGVFEKWSRLKINLAIRELDALLSNNLTLLQSNFAGNHHAGNTFTYNYPDTKIILDDPLVLWKEHSPYLLFLIVLLFHILLLLPYFLVKTHIYPPDRNLSGGIELRKILNP
jgi:hypothetical protein